MLKVSKSMKNNDFKFVPQVKKPLRNRIIAGVAVFALILGTVLYFTWPREIPGEDIPPTLSAGSAALKGAFIDQKYNFYNCEQSDVDAERLATKEAQLTEQFGESTVVKPGVHFYYVKNKQSLDTIFKKNLLCVAGNQLLFALYSPGEDGLEKGFHVYPKGIFEGTKEILDLNEFKVPAYRVFAVISKVETKIWNVESEADEADQFPKPLKNNERGWVQVPRVANLKAALEEYQDRIDLSSEGELQIWTQDNENSFARVASLDALGNGGVYKTVWLKLKEKVSVSD